VIFQNKENALNGLVVPQDDSDEPFFVSSSKIRLRPSGPHQVYGDDKDLHLVYVNEHDIIHDISASYASFTKGEGIFSKLNALSNQRLLTPR
jgi:hypothetical protein